MCLCVREGMLGVAKPEVRMQSKNAVTIVHAMVGMCGMHKLYIMCVIWNTDIVRTLEYSVLA